MGMNLEGDCQNVIDVRGLTKRFKTRTGMYVNANIGPAQWMVDLFMKRSSEIRECVAVNKVTLQIKKGERFGLVGPNGAGKTTLLKCISTLLLPDEGEILVNGADTVKEADLARNSINLIGSLQWSGFDWGLSLEENLRFWGRLYGLSNKDLKQNITRVLGVTGLEAKRFDTPQGLSAGQRQKLILCKGLIYSAPIILLDEPSVGLDPVSASSVRSFITDELLRNNLTMILTSHNLAEIDCMCERVAVIVRGKIVACDHPSKLKEIAKVDNVLELIVDASATDTVDICRKVDGIKSVWPIRQDPVALTSTLRMSCESRSNLAKDVTLALIKQGILVRACRPISPTLDDAFSILAEGR